MTNKCDVFFYRNMMVGKQPDRKDFGHQTSPNRNEFWLPQVANVSQQSGLFFITPIFRTGKIYVTHESRCTLMDIYPCLFYRYSCALGILLMDSGFKIVHRAGINHQTTDALFRLRTDSSVSTLLEDDIPVKIGTPSNK